MHNPDEHNTILSVLENMQYNRIGADAVMLVSTDYTLLADTMRPDVRAETFFADRLIEIAEEQGDAAAIVFIGDDAHQMVVVPILAPVPVAWLCVSFAIDQAMVEALQALTLSHLTLFRPQQNGTTAPLVSSLPGDLLSAMSAALPRLEQERDESFILPIGHSRYVTIATRLYQEGGVAIIALLQRSLDKALAPFYRLRSILIAISLGGLFASILAGLFIARSVTRPVVHLVGGVRQIGKGNYTHQVAIEQPDELGELGRAFNSMAAGLEERDKVRSVLGKVVSPAVAHELVNKDVRLGGEERLMTAFFSDIAGFTSISERLQPDQLVALLNEYLSAMADTIYQTEGVVDKYIGDAIVAFWGAPIPQQDHAILAVQAAVEMQQKLELMRRQWRQAGQDELFVRIGLNSGQIVVGSMGSTDRLDYTMMGDAVNLASRLEGANKYYGSGILISEFTYAQLQDRFLCRELDLVRVEGKNEAIAIYEVFDQTEAAEPEQFPWIGPFASGLQAFRRADWPAAAAHFAHSDRLRDGGDKPSQLYLQRLKDLVANPPDADWDKVYQLEK